VIDHGLHNDEHSLTVEYVNVSDSELRDVSVPTVGIPPGSWQVAFTNPVSCSAGLTAKLWLKRASAIGLERRD
jgi:acyl dehydratase